jgi:phosphatidyl-myo-inositol dimannoside synthase
MNILALVTDAFGGAGGIAQYNRDLVRALALCPGTKRLVVVPRLGDLDDEALPAGVCQLKPRVNQIAYLLAALGAAIKLGPFDFVFCGHMHLAPLAALLARQHRIPMWLQLHGWEAWEQPSRAERWAAEQAALITSVSRYTRRRFLSIVGGDPLRVRVLPNTVDPVFSPGAKSDALLDRYGLRGKLVILTVGRLDPHERCKGHDKVIKALPQIMKTFGNVVYLVVGEGHDRGRLEALGRDVGVEDAVMFAGRVKPEELPQVYRLADLFVMPSTQEGFGIVFLEASASGVRTVGGKTDGSVDALADGALGSIVDPEDTAALVNVINEGLRRVSPAPAGVCRFGFDNFAGHVRELVSRNLLNSTAATAA